MSKKLCMFTECVDEEPSNAAGLGMRMFQLLIFNVFTRLDIFIAVLLKI